MTGFLTSTSNGPPGSPSSWSVGKSVLTHQAPEVFFDNISRYISISLDLPAKLSNSLIPWTSRLMRHARKIIRRTMPIPSPNPINKIADLQIVVRYARHRGSKVIILKSRYCPPTKGPKHKIKAFKDGAMSPDLWIFIQNRLIVICKPPPVRAVYKLLHLHVGDAIRFGSKNKLVRKSNWFVWTFGHFTNHTSAALLAFCNRSFPVNSAKHNPPSARPDFARFVVFLLSPILPVAIFANIRRKR